MSNFGVDGLKPCGGKPSATFLDEGISRMLGLQRYDTTCPKGVGSQEIRINASLADLELNGIPFYN